MQVQLASVVECVLPDDEAGRVFQVIDRGSDRQPRWVLRLTARTLGQRVADLPLAGARIARDGSAWTLTSDSANGGARVHIETRGQASTIDVFVNFELEVNVWRDLSPDVEQMNTDGPRRDASCRVLSDGVRMPYHPS